MTPEQRKERSEEILTTRGVTIYRSLPVIESEAETRLRKPQEVAGRVICLLCVAAAADGVDRGRLRAWLQREGLWAAATPNETDFLEADEAERHVAVQFGWRSEGIWLLLWAMNLVDELEPPTQQCQVSAILDLVPAFDESTKAFVAQARLRTVAEILDVSDLTYRAHWATRDRKLGNATNIGDLERGVVYERHYAVNWLTRYGEDEEEGVDAPAWDDVSTDT